MKKNKIMGRIGLFLALAFMALIPGVSAVASFAVNTFSCTPEEVAINNDFSCTAQIINNGDAAGSVSVATLYSDSNDWLEESNYGQSSGTSVDPGQTTEVTFSGMRATKSGGSNGFSKITLDSVTDTSGVDGVAVNVIDVAITASNSASSKAASQEFTSTAEVTAGGNIDVLLTFSVDSGGCSIGNQDATKTLNNMQNNDRQSQSWTVTMGTTGDCRYTITSVATGDAGVGTKSDSVSKTVTCSSGCTSASSSSSSSSGGGGGGGGGIGTLIKDVGEIITSVQEEIGKGENIAFKFGGTNHSISVTNLTETTATIVVRSQEFKLTMTVGEEKKIDFESDGRYDINIRLQSVNIIKKKATFIVTPLYLPGSAVQEGSKDAGSAGSEGDAAGSAGSKDAGKAAEGSGKGGINYWWIIGLIIGIIIVGAGILILKNFHKQDTIRRAVHVRRFTIDKSHHQKKS